MGPPLGDTACCYFNEVLYFGAPTLRPSGNTGVPVQQSSPVTSSTHRQWRLTYRCIWGEAPRVREYRWA